MSLSEEWKTRILTKSDLEKVWDMKKSLEMVENTLRWIGEGKVQQVTCQDMNPHTGTDDFSFILAHPAWIKPLNIVGNKWSGCCKSNPAKGLTYSNGVTVLSDPDTIRPIAIMDSIWLTSLRTASMFAIGAKYLARKDSSVLAIIGCGAQAKQHLVAMMEVGFPIKTLKICDLSRDAMEAFKAFSEARYPDVAVQFCAGTAEACADADIICMITTFRGPLLKDEMVKPGAHVVATCLWDIDIPVFRNSDKWVVGNGQIDSFNFVDHFEKQYGIGMKDAYACLDEIVCGKKPGRESAAERTSMVHLGMGANDVAVGYGAYKLAVEAGLGFDVCLYS